MIRATESSLPAQKLPQHLSPSSVTSLTQLQPCCPSECTSCLGHSPPASSGVLTTPMSRTSGKYPCTPWDLPSQCKPQSRKANRGLSSSSGPTHQKILPGKSPSEVTSQLNQEHEVLGEPPVQQAEPPIPSSSPNQTTAMTFPNHQILFFLWNLPSSSAETRLPPTCSVPQPGSRVSPSEPHRNKSISSEEVSRQNDNP